MPKTPSFAGPLLAALLSLAGIAGFVVLFARDMTVFWFILAPLILIVYQFPAFVVFRMWKRRRARLLEGSDEDIGDRPDGAEPDAAPDPSSGEEIRPGSGD